MLQAAPSLALLSACRSVAATNSHHPSPRQLLSCSYSKLSPLGAAVVPFLASVLVGRLSLLKYTTEEKKGTLILTSLLEHLAPYQLQHRVPRAMLRSYGYVCKGTNKATGSVRAVKTIAKAGFGERIRRAARGFATEVLHQFPWVGSSDFHFEMKSTLFSELNPQTVALFAEGSAATK